MSMELKMSGLWRYVQDDEIHDAEPLVKVAQDTLESCKGAGNDFLGWLDLPENYDREEFARIKQAAEKIRRTADVLIVIGIGGSYLGARAAIEFVNGQMYNQSPPGGHARGLLCRQQYFLQLSERSGQDCRRPGLLHQCYLQIGYDDRTGHCVSYLQGALREEIRPRGREGAHLCDHGQGARRTQAACGR